MQLYGWEAIIFYILAFSTLIMGVLVVSSRAAIHSALFLLGTVINVGMLFILLRAELAAGVQILIYAGGVILLLLVALMLRQPRQISDEQSDLYTKHMWPGVLLALLLAGGFFFAMNPAQPAFRPSADLKQTDASLSDSRKELAGAGSAVSNDTQNVGDAFYKTALLPFEITSVLLLVAVIGAALVARSLKQEPLYSKSEIAAAEETTEPDSDDDEAAEVAVESEETRTATTETETKE